MKDHKGYSLIELIVIIAIIAVIGAGVFGMTGLLNGKNAKECATKTNSALAGSRTDALAKSEGASKYDVYIRIYSDGGNIYIDSVVKGVTTTERVGNSRVTVTAVKGTLGTDSSDTTITLDGTNEIIIAFNRSDGSFNPVKDEAGVYWKKLCFTQGSVTYQIELTARTGKFSLSRS